MATGDAAGAAGLITYGNDLLVTDVDVALNQRGDDTAAVMARTKTLEAQSIGVPKFSVKRSTNGQSIAANAWRQITGGAWATPIKSVGGFTWTGGVLTIPRAGYYDVTAHVMLRTNDYATVAIQVTRNTTSVDTTNTSCANETSITPPEPGSNLNLGVTASGKAAYNAGDLVRVFVLQRNRAGNDVLTGQNSFDLTFDVLWVDSL